MSGTRARLDAAVKTLKAAGVPGAARDAARLLQHISPGALTADALPDETWAAFDVLVARRAAREPVSHLIGHRAFWAHDFLVTPDVLDPRPDTETLVEEALNRDWNTVLDLGTGSGAILLSLLAERLTATGTGTDISAAALGIAGQNAARLNLKDRATLLQSDWFAGVTGKFDLIVSNPPYITADEMTGLAPELRHEPQIALTPGGDGLDAYRAITARARQFLTPHGALMVEIGATQGPSVQALFQNAGLEDIAIHPDLDGRNRVIAGRNPAPEPEIP